MCSRNKLQQNLNNFFNFSVENYNQLRLNKKIYSSYDNIKQTKKLILDTKKYNKYTNYYYQLTRDHTFKLPNVSEYPMEKNKEILPIRNKKFISNIKIVKVLFKNKNIINKKIEDEKEKEKEKEDEKKLEKSNSINKIYNKMNLNEIKFLNIIDLFNNDGGVIYKYMNYKEKYFINKNEAIIEKFFENKIDSYEINFQSINSIKNEFMIKNNIKIKIIINSLTLYFYNNDKKVVKIKFPFEFLPFYFLVSYKNFNKFLINILEYKEESKTFIINEKKFKNFYKEIAMDKDFALENKNNLNNVFNWIIDRTRLKLMIELPCMKIVYKNIFFNNKVTFKKNLDYNYIYYFLDKNFLDWDLICMENFSGYKKFREINNKILSYNLTNLNNKKIYNLNKKIYVNNKNHFEFFISKKVQLLYFNYYFLLKSPKIQIAFTKPNNNLNNLLFNNFYFSEMENKFFTISFKTAIQLYKLKNYFEPEDLIYKSIEIKNLDLSSKENFSDKIKLISSEKILNEIDSKIFNFDFEIIKFIQKETTNLKNKNIMIFIPSLILNWIDNNNFIEKFYKMSKEETEKLFDIKKDSWDFFFVDNFENILKKSTHTRPNKIFKSETMNLKKTKEPRNSKKKSFRSSINSRIRGSKNKGQNLLQKNFYK